MLRLIAYLFIIVVAATGLSWLADRPGDLMIDWQGYRIETSVFSAVVGFALTICALLAIWVVLTSIWKSPVAIGNFLKRRRQKRGLEALSGGIIAIGAGDRAGAVRYSAQARKSLPNEPLTHLLRAQAAQLSGDKATARRIFEAMLGAPDTEQLGLRGLFLEAQREGEREAAIQFAQRAVKLNPKLDWAVNALFDLQCRDGDWSNALETLAVARSYGHIDKTSANRRRAVLLTAQAQAAEDNDPERALNLALEAHGLAVDLVPASAIAGRILASRGNTPRATKILQKTWAKQPHPDLATAYAYARLGDSPHDRLTRVAKLAQLNPHSAEGPIAIATAAIEARDFGAARNALKPLLDGRLTQRVATLMARIEGEEHGDKGRVREWLARAVNAPRDPVWTADGVVSETWAPISPVSGALDAFQWRVPVENLHKRDGDILAQKLEELVELGNASAPAVSEAKDITPAVVPNAQTTTTNYDAKIAKSEPANAGRARNNDAAAVAAAAVPVTTTQQADEPATTAAKGTVVVAAEAPVEDIEEGVTTTTTEEIEVRPASANEGSATDDSSTAGATADEPETTRASKPVALQPLDLEDDVEDAASGKEPSDKSPEKIDKSRKSQRSKTGTKRSGKASAKRSRTEKPGTPKQADPNIFVSPRAPDDPGTEDVETNQWEPPPRRARAP